MKSVRMRDFVDYCLSSGTARFNLASRLKRGDAGVDFYAPLREAIAALGPRLEASLEDFLNERTDERECTLFPDAVAGYRRFLRSKTVSPFEPPQRELPVGPVLVDVRADLGLVIDGQPHAIALWFGVEEVTPARQQLVRSLLHTAFSSTWPGTTFGLLDVRRAHLFDAPPRSTDTLLLMRSEAASLATLEASL